MRVGIPLAAMALIALSGPLAAQAPQFLAPADAVRVVADGKPWNGVTADGRKARITLNRDGSGSFEGPITLSISWAVMQEDICIKISIAGTKCLRFRRIAGGVEGWNAKGRDLTLTR